MIQEKHIIEAAKIIQEGGLVAFPTETVYGLGANAFDPIAVAKIFAVKERPSFDPLIVHIASIEDIKKVYNGDDDRIYKLAEKFWPGPLTMVLPKTDAVSDIVTSGLDTVGVRMPDNPIALELIKQAKTPLAAPSANKFGMISPTEAGHVKRQLPGIFTIDGGKTKVGIESTVVSINDYGFEILRPGFITSQDLQSVLPMSKITGQESQLKSPGLLKSHYSPKKPLYIIENPCVGVKNQSTAGLILFGEPDNLCNYAEVEILSKTRNLTEAAANLFSALHRLDNSKVEYIVAKPVPETGIGIAIMDRLTKASHQSNETS